MSSSTRSARPRVLVTGATGYVGGRLVPALEAEGVPLRCLTRNPQFLASRVASGTEIVRGDVLDPPSMRRAMQGIDVAYYLVHSMGSSGDFEAEDREGARAFAAAARAVGVKRIVYLGGLGRGSDLSPHLSSRHEVGRILRESGVPTIEFRASIILGSGSLSFELIRALVERLPVMITPRWVRVAAQPIAIEDVLAYLVAALDSPLKGSAVFEIGGADRVSYGDIMKEYARLRGLKRMMISVPVLTPRLSSLWLTLVTPVYARVGRRLIGSIRHPTVVEDQAALWLFPVRPRGIRESLARALAQEDAGFARTRWSDAVSSGDPRPRWGGRAAGARIVDARSIEVPHPPGVAFAPIRRIGGDTGWYYGGWLWALRGLIDAFVGGVGLRRGRRDPEQLQAGDTVDFWRVEAVEPDRLLRLRAEMRLPGRAWLQFEVRPAANGSEVCQTAIFDPAGLAGLAYWYLLYPLHRLVFAGMLRGITRAMSVEPRRGHDVEA